MAQKQIVLSIKRGLITTQTEGLPGAACMLFLITLNGCQRLSQSIRDGSRTINRDLPPHLPLDLCLSASFDRLSWSRAFNGISGMPAHLNPSGRCFLGVLGAQSPKASPCRPMQVNRRELLPHRAGERASEPNLTIPCKAKKQFGPISIQLELMVESMPMARWLQVESKRPISPACLWLVTSSM